MSSDNQSKNLHRQTECAKAVVSAHVFSIKALHVGYPHIVFVHVEVAVLERLINHKAPRSVAVTLLVPTQIGVGVGVEIEPRLFMPIPEAFVGDRHVAQCIDGILRPDAVN